jgi:hypothetical protein
MDFMITNGFQCWSRAAKHGGIAISIAKGETMVMEMDLLCYPE